MSVHLKSPQELRDYLAEPGRKKHRGAMQDHQDPDACCCLGHYAVQCGIKFLPLAGSFLEESEYFRNSTAAAEGRPWLPDGHWLFASFKLSSQYTSAAQSILAQLNDKIPEEGGSDTFVNEIAWLDEHMDELMLIWSEYQPVTT